MTHLKRFGGLLGCAILLTCLSCAGPEARRYVRDGKVYGVTKGPFRERWWNYYDRGLSFSDGRFWKEAEADLRKALEQRDRDQRRARTYGMHFTDYFPHRELGVVLFHKVDYEGAIQELETSLKSVKSAKAEYYLDLARKAVIETQDADTAPPEISIDAPAPGALTNGFSVLVHGTVKDDTYVKEVLVNGVPVRIDLAQPEVPFRVSVPLTPGENQIMVLATDLSGKISLAQREVRVDTLGPILSIDQPEEGAPRPRDGVRLKGYASDDSGIKRIQVNDEEILEAPVREAVLDRSVYLPPGENRLRVEVWDMAGNRTLAEIHFSEGASSTKGILVVSLNAPRLALFGKKGKQKDIIPPMIELRGWTGKQTVFSDQAYLEGSARDKGGIQHLTINDLPILRKPGRNVYFSHLAGLNEGDNLILIEAVDTAGNRAEKRINIQRKRQKVREIGSRLNVALLPFQRKGESRMIGEAAEEILLGLLVERCRFNMVGRERLEEVLREQRLSRTDLADQAAALRVGKLLAAQGVLTGSILERGGSVEIFARMVDTETTLILTAIDVFGKDVDPQTLRQLCRGLVLKLCDELPLVEGLVIQVKDERMTLDLGKASKIKRGMRLIVFKEGEPIRHPVTGKTLVSDVEELGHGRIQAVQEQSSFAEILEEQALTRIKPMHKVITQ